MGKNKEFDEVLSMLEDIYGWNDTNELTQIQQELVNDVISAVKILNIPVVSVECEHPFAYVHTRCMGEINYCLKCGKDL